MISIALESLDAGVYDHQRCRLQSNNNQVNKIVGATTRNWQPSGVVYHRLTPMSIPTFLQCQAARAGGDPGPTASAGLEA
jgi:hypothetical protein